MIAVTTSAVDGMAQSLAVRLPTVPGYLVGIPRGGVSAAYAVAQHARGWRVSTPLDLPSVTKAPAVLVDDIVFTGATMLRYEGGQYNLAMALMRKGDRSYDLPVVVARSAPEGQWVQFPWEQNEAAGPEDAVTRLIEYLGDDPTRPGLKDTPRRVLGFLEEMRSAADADFSPTTFESKVGDLVVLRGLPFYTLCEHHMLPVFGSAAVGYIPDGRIIGLSKIPRLIAQESARLTTQEELTASIAEGVGEMLSIENVAAVTAATHTCMLMRGPRVSGVEAVSSAMLGAFQANSALRAEFMTIVGGTL